VPPRSSLDAELRGEALKLVVAYHASARAELIQRLAHRDTALAIFLAGSAVILGAVLRLDDLTDEAATVLLIVPLLGLGASYVRAQHNSVMGALGEYLGLELDQATKRLLRDDNGGLAAELIPSQWDASRTLLSYRGHVLARETAGRVLLVGPQVAAGAIAVAEIGFSGLGLACAIVAAALSALSFLTLQRSAVERQRRTERIRAHHRS
jgi:hypothetical protein